MTKWTRLDDPAWSYPNDAHRARILDLLGLAMPAAPEVKEPAYRHDLYEVVGEGGTTSHPCEKPAWVVAGILARIANPGELILDPFAGSGTTLVAAKGLGLRAVGVEIEDRFCRQAVERLRQGSLLGPTPSQATS